MNSEQNPYHSSQTSSPSRKNWTGVIGITFSLFVLLSIGLMLLLFVSVQAPARMSAPTVVPVATPPAPTPTPPAAMPPPAKIE